MPNKEDLIYFLSLELENVRCFGRKQILDLTDGCGNPARWTLLLGENGLGKTTLSECLLWMKFVPAAVGNPQNLNNSDDKITKGPMEPSLPEAENDVIESFIRVGCQQLDLKAKFSQGVQLGKNLAENKRSSPIKTGISVIFKNQELENYIADKNENSNIEDILGGKYKEPFILTYGASRARGNLTIYQTEQDTEGSASNSLASRLSGRTELYNAEEILRYFENKSLKSKEKIRKNSKQETLEEQLFADFKQIVADILPTDEIKIKDINFYDPPRGVCLNTFSGKDIPFSALSLGYQTTICLAIDIAWRLFQYYPNSKTPRTQPAIILIDEIDLHLHPRWQRLIIEKLGNIFTSTQFIATTHSALMVQSATDVNLAVLQKDENEVRIENDLEVVHGWRVDQLRVDQILNSPIFGLENSRGSRSEELFKDRAELLGKLKRTPKEEVRLAQIRDEIGNLPTVSSMEEMEFIRRATTLLEQK